MYVCSQSCPTLSTPWTVAHQALLSMDFFQARTLEWVAISYSWGSAQHRDRSCISSTAGSLLHCRQILYYWAISEAHCESESVSCSVLPDFLWPHGLKPTWLLCHGIFQSRILEWFSISFSRGLSQPRDQTLVSCTAGRFFTIWATREALTCVKTHWTLAFHCLPFVTQ